MAANFNHKRLLAGRVVLEDYAALKAGSLSLKDVHGETHAGFRLWITLLNVIEYPLVFTNTSMRQSGRIASWKDGRGFGFIRPSAGGNEIFVHISAFANRSRRPSENEVVTYQVRTDAQGRLRADQVWFAGDRMKRPAPSNRPVVHALLLAGIFLIVVATLAVTGRLPPTVLALYITASAVAFVAYAWDKSAARNDRWRTSESTLHLLGLSGGWPGALIARQVFRHKSKKQSFIATFWTTVVLNCGALAWLLSPAGQRFFESTMGAA